MSLVFGVWMSLVGVAIVFVTILAVAAASEGLQRILSAETEAPRVDRRERARVAAVAAACCFMGLGGRRRPRLRVAAAPSRWSDVARVEALRLGEVVSDGA